MQELVLFATLAPLQFLHYYKVVYSCANQDSDLDHILWSKYFLIFPLMSFSSGIFTEFPDRQITLLVAGITANFQDEQET